MIQATDNIIIKGAWDTTPDPPNSIIMRLAPMDHRLAYGFGWNPSTQGMLRAMERVGVVGKVVLDVGTGTGILAIAAAKMGAAKVYAVDISGEALELAQENVRLNGVDVSFEAPERADVILANMGDSQWVRDNLPLSGSVLLASLPEQADVVGYALMNGFAIHSDLVGEGQERFAIVTIRRP